ncbi:RND transporter, partial [Burkholderia sp. Tr-860]|nr:RND transporter [Burkholderia sp. Tr-860]
AAARVRLGALPPSAGRASEQQYRNAQLDAIRATSSRLADTARLFQAMGTPPDPAGKLAALPAPDATAK